MFNYLTALRSKSRLFLACLFLSQVCFGATQGPNSPSTGGNDATVGTISWSNTSNIVSSENTYASCSLSSGQSSNYLTATNFSFSIPTGATILDISVHWERSHSSVMASVVDSNIRIIKGGVISATNNSFGDAWTNSDAYQAYTGLWGETWTAADINASNFGVALSASYSGGIGSTTLNADHVRIYVLYVDPSTNKQMWQVEEIFD